MGSRPHRKTVKHYEGNGHLHELTFSCIGRKPLLTNDPWRRILAQSLQRALDEEDFGLIAFVFMPEHVHLLVLSTNETASVSRLLARTKQAASKEIKELLQQSNSPLLN